jgi:hypothetical protein
MTSELWERMGYGQHLYREAWPTVDPAFLVTDTVTVVIQVNGKLRDRVEVSPDIAEDALLEMALALPKVEAALGGAEIKRKIVVPGKLVNLVVGGKNQLVNWANLTNNISFSSLSNTNFSLSLSKISLDGTHDALQLTAISLIPEPSTLAGAAAGLILLAFVRRRRA